MKISSSFYFCCLFGLSLSCNSQDKNIEISKGKRDAIELNNRAMDIFIRNRNSKDSISKSMNLLNAAIEIDSSYERAYSNKSTILISLGDYSEALKTLDRILTMKPTLAELKTLKGLILEKTGENDKALITYKEVLNIYSDRLAKDSANVNLLLDRALIYFFAEGNDRGVKEFKKIQSLYPSNSEVQSRAEMFMRFNRKEYIDSFFPN